MKDNPYVGPRPYGRKDRDNFYEHNRKARGLLAKIMAERVVLFYVQSGAGKSSLLNALIGQEKFSTSPLHGETKKNTFALNPLSTKPGEGLTLSPYEPLKTKILYTRTKSLRLREKHGM